MNKAIKGGLLASLVFAGLPEPAADTPANFESLLAQAPERAVPATFFKHSSNLDHLNEPPQPPVVAAPPVKDTLKIPFLSRGISKSFSAFKEACPAVPASDEAGSWLIKNITVPQWQAAPRSFQEKAYFMAADMPQSTTKIDLLTSISAALPDAKFLSDYLEDKRIVLERKLASDPVLVKAAKDWPSESPAYKEKILNHVSRVTLDVLLPGKDIEYPKVIFLRHNYAQMGALTFGRYQAFYNEIYINGMLKPILWDFQRASQTTVHESLHMFESTLIDWMNKGAFQNAPEMRTQAEIYKISIKSGGSQIRAEQSSVGYRISSIERGPFGFQRAAIHAGKGDHIPSPQKTYLQDMFLNYPLSGRPAQKVIPVEPVYKSNPSEGIIPAACARP